MFGLKSISRWQFALIRVALGVYLTVHFAQLLPYAGELFSKEGTLGDASLSPLFGILPSPLWLSDSVAMATALTGAGCVASIAFAMGCWRKLAAILALYIWASLYGRNPLISNPSLGYVGLMLVLSLLIPNAEALRLRKATNEKWFYPSGVYWTAWWLLAIGYTFSGVIKLQSPSWWDGTALLHLAENPLARPGTFRDLLLLLPLPVIKLLTWPSLASEILYLPLSFFRKGRCAVWVLMLAMHLGIMLVVDFLDLTAAMVLIHLFTFDPDWVAGGDPKKMRLFFFDGDCGFCARSVNFLLQEDRDELIKFAPLQGETAKAWLPPELRDLPDLSTAVFVLHDPATGKTERWIRSRAVFGSLVEIGGFWRVVGTLGLLIPGIFREGAYRFVAKHRLKLIPKAACALPTPEERKRLLP